MSDRFNMVAEEGNRRARLDDFLKVSVLINILSLNRRKGGMSKDEAHQCVLDVKTWFERNTRLQLQGFIQFEFKITKSIIELLSQVQNRQILKDLTSSLDSSSRKVSN